MDPSGFITECEKMIGMEADIKRLFRKPEWSNEIEIDGVKIEVDDRNIINKVWCPKCKCELEIETHLVPSACLMYTVTPERYFIEAKCKCGFKYLSEITDNEYKWRRKEFPFFVDWKLKRQ